MGWVIGFPGAGGVIGGGTPIDGLDAIPEHHLLAKGGTPTTVKDFGVSSSSTGLISGGALSAGGVANTINVAAGTGHIYNFTDATAPTYIEVTWTAFSDVALANLATENSTYLAIDSAGDLQQFTPTQQANMERDYIVLGVVTHITGAVEQIANKSIKSIEPYSQLLDLLSVLGVVRGPGLDIGLNANMTFSKSSGQILLAGGGNITNYRKPNVREIPPESPQSFARVLALTDTIEVASTDQVRANIYDDGTAQGGILAPGAAQILYVYQFAIDDKVTITYGQTAYANGLTEAISSADVDASNHQLPPGFLTNALLLFRLIVIGSATNLSDPAQAVYLTGPKFGAELAGGVGGSGSGGDFFGPSSSATNEIVTFADTTGKIGSNSADISAIDGVMVRATAGQDLNLQNSGTGSVVVGVSQNNATVSSSDITLRCNNAITIRPNNNASTATGIYIRDETDTPRSAIGWQRANNSVALLNGPSFAAGLGIHVYNDGRVSMGQSTVNDTNFSVIMSGSQPIGLPDIGDIGEASLIGVARQLHFNSDSNRLRYWDGTAYKSVANLDDASGGGFVPGTQDLDQLGYAYKAYHPLFGNTRRFVILPESRGLPLGTPNGEELIGLEIRPSETDGSCSMSMGWQPGYGGAIQVQGAHLYFRNLSSGSGGTPRVIHQNVLSSSNITGNSVWVDAEIFVDEFWPNCKTQAEEVSTERLKVNIRKLKDHHISSLDIVKKIEPILYDGTVEYEEVRRDLPDWRIEEIAEGDEPKASEKTKRIIVTDRDRKPENRGKYWDIVGFSAENIADVIPELSLRDSDGRVNNINQKGIVALLVEAVKQLSEEIEELKKRV